jgi:ABC-2 type transport system ATP-binding protein
MMITARNISVAFGRGFFRPKIKALDSFSLTVREGDVFALLGPNGAGKSTAMYCFLGLVRPDSGSISVLGRTPGPGSPLFREIAYLPEEPHYHQYLTVEEAVAYYAHLHGNGVNKQRVNKAIERVGMSEFRDLRLSKCSKGMKQKAGIAACLVNKPRLVFLDEPTRGLDPVMVKEFRNILIEMNKAGTTIVLNSHVLSEIEMICNRAAIMDKGKVIAQDEMNRLRGTGLETYQVEFDHMDPAPPSVRVIIRTPTTIKGEIPTEKLGEFVQQVDGSGKKIYECSLKRLSLEDSFFNILTGKGGNKASEPPKR